LIIQTVVLRIPNCDITFELQQLVKENAKNVGKVT